MFGLSVFSSYGSSQLFRQIRWASPGALIRFTIRSDFLLVIIYNGTACRQDRLLSFVKMFDSCKVNYNIGKTGFRKINLETKRSLKLAKASYVLSTRDLISHRPVNPVQSQDITLAEI